MFKGISRLVLLLAAISLFTDIASELLFPVMPIYLKTIGFSIAAIALLEGFAEAIAGVSKSYFGAMSDKYNTRLPFVQAGYGISALAKILLAATSIVPLVFTSRFADRLGKGLRTAARDAMLANESTPQNKTSIFAFHRSMDTTGAVIGPAIALVYLYYHPQDYKTLLWVATIPGLIAVLLTFALMEKKNAEPLTRKSFFHLLGYWKIASPGYKFLFSIAIIFALVNSADALLLLMLKTKGYSDSKVISLYVIYNLCYALTAYPIGVLADKIGVKKIVAFGLMLFAIVYFWLVRVDYLPLLVLLLILYGLYAACFESGIKSLIVSNSEKSQHASALGFYSGWASVSALCAAAWTGWLWQHSAMQWPFTVSACVALLCSLLLFYYKNIQIVQN
jgi:MFS family permease